MSQPSQLRKRQNQISANGDYHSIVTRMKGGFAAEAYGAPAQLVTSTNGLDGLAPLWSIERLLVAEVSRRLVHGYDCVVRTVTQFVDWSFAVACPRVWNSLPGSLGLGTGIFESHGPNAKIWDKHKTVRRPAS